MLVEAPYGNEFFCMFNAGSCKIFSAHSVSCFKKKKVPTFGPLKNGCYIVVSESGFKSSKGKCALESLVQSRLEHSLSCVSSSGCFFVVLWVMWLVVLSLA